MQNKTFYNFLEKIIKEEQLSSSQIANSILRSSDFETLINSDILKYKSANGGGVYQIGNKDALINYFSNKFPNELKKTYSAVSNIHTFRNTKARKRESQNIILIRGFKEVKLNDSLVNLEKYTLEFGTFSAQIKKLETDKICFVENLDSFLLAEQVIGKDYIFIHTYGGIGRPTVKKVIAKEILVFPDYDFKGLHNYLLVKSIFEKTKLFIPSNYYDLYQRISRTIKTKNGREQQPSKLVKESTDVDVIRIKTDIFKHKKFLEQQAIFNND